MNDSDEIHSDLTKCTCNNIVTPSGGLPQETWKYVMNQLTRSMYHTTAVGVPPPERHIIATNSCEYCQQYQQKQNTFNADILSTKDMSHYRQQRSESLLFRIYRKVPLELDKINVLRIDNGVFIAQQTRPPSQPSSSIQLPNSILDAFLNDTFVVPGNDSQDTTSISNFDFNALTQLITNSNVSNYTHQQQETSSTACLDNFIPYTYTVGSRYTSINDYRKDYIIRGVTPLWCQTLLLDRIYNAQPPIEANETRYGLIPFAPDLPLTFHGFLDYRNRIHEMDNVDGGFDDPEMLIWYERFAMDDAGGMVVGHASDYSDAYWGANRLDVLRKLVYCHIPPDLAQMIGDLGTQWVKNDLDWGKICAYGDQ